MLIFLSICIIIIINYITFSIPICFIYIINAFGTLSIVISITICIFLPRALDIFVFVLDPILKLTRLVILQSLFGFFRPFVHLVSPEFALF